MVVPNVMIGFSLLMVTNIGKDISGLEMAKYHRLRTIDSCIHLLSYLSTWTASWSQTTTPAKSMTSLWVELLNLWNDFRKIVKRSLLFSALLRHGYGCFCLGYPTPAQMRPNHLFLAKAGACVRFHLDSFQDYDFRSNLDNRKCDSLFHGLYFWKWTNRFGVLQ